MKIGTEVYHNLKNVIKAKFGLDVTAVGDERRFAPNILDILPCEDKLKNFIININSRYTI